LIEIYRSRAEDARDKGPDTVNTSQYDTQTRKNVKRFQRTPGYQAMKKEHLAAREQLEIKLRERNEVIDRLKKKLVEAGVNADEVAKLAA
jgi:predicted nuclease with TOPRIM domain